MRFVRIALLLSSLCALMATTLGVVSADQRCSPGDARHGRCKTPTSVPIPQPQPPAVLPTPIPVVTPSVLPTVIPVDACLESLQSRIDRTPDNGTLDLPACTWREQATITRPMRVDGHSQAWVKGSDVWSAWTGAHPWVSAQILPAQAINGIDSQYNVPTCTDGSSDCNQPYAVFRDGSGLRWVSGTPGNGEFSRDADGHVLLGDDPRDQVIEIATRQTALTISGSDVVVYGITFEQTWGTYQRGAVVNISGSRVTFEHNSVFRGGYAGIAVSGQDDRLLGNELSWNSGLGVAAPGAYGLLIQGGTIQRNNRRQAEGHAGSDYWYGWEASGVKITNADQSLVQGVRSWDNGGPGIWCDIECKQTTFSENESARNLSNGFEFEGGVGPFLIDHNNSLDNQGCGILVALNQHVQDGTGTVSNNLLQGNSGPSICKGYANTEVQPGITYAGNSP